VLRRTLRYVASQKTELLDVEEQNARHLLFNGAWFGLIDGGILTYLPVYLARLGASASILSLLTSGPALLGIAAYIPGGIFTERRRDQVQLTVRAGMLVRLGTLLIALLPFFLAPTLMAPAAVVIYSAISIPSAVYIPAWTTVMGKAISPARRAQVNGARWSLYSLVSAVSIAGFGYLLDRSPLPIGYQGVFMISFLAGVAGLYSFGRMRIPPFVQERNASQEDGTGAGLAGRLRGFLRPLAECREFVRFNMATLVYRLILSMPAALYSLYWVNNLHASNTWIGLRGTVGYSALVVGYRFWGRTANRIGHRKLLYLAGGCFALYPIVTALAGRVEWLLPAAVIWGFCASGLDIGLFDMLLAACPEGRQPSFAATANMLVSAVAFVGPLLGAALAQSLNTRAALFIIGALQLASIVFFRLLPSREQEALAGHTD
jgi:MFS family permease